MSRKTIVIIGESVSANAGYLQIIEGLEMDVIPLVYPTFSKAREILETEQVDLIILDLVLPDVLRTDVLEELRRKRPDVPILLVTGHPEELDRENAERFHVSGFFIKPFHVDAFEKAVHSSLRGLEYHDPGLAASQ